MHEGKCHATCACTKAFDPKKPVHTRGCLPARIICTDRKGHRSIVVLIEEDGKEIVYGVHPDGRYHLGTDSSMDLVNIKVKKWKWVIRWKHTIVGDECHVTEHHYTESEIKNRWPSSQIVGRIKETEIEE